MLGARAHTARILAEGTGDRGGTDRFTGLRGVLVGVEVALASSSLSAAGLMIKSVSRLIAVEPGLDPRSVLVMEVALPQTISTVPPKRTGFWQDLDANVSAATRRAGRLARSVICRLAARRPAAVCTIEGRRCRPRTTPRTRCYRLTCPGYFRRDGYPDSSRPRLHARR